MERTLISDTINKIGETVLIKGRVTVRRDHGKIVFLDIFDYTAVIQVVLTTELSGDLRTGDALAVEGPIKARPEKLVNAKLLAGTVEMEAKKIDILAKISI